MKLTVYIFRRAGCFRGIVKSYVQSFSDFTRKHWAAFICPTADRNNIVPLLPYIQVYTFRDMVSYVYTHFIHNLYRHRINLFSRFCSCRKDIQLIVK